MSICSIFFSYYIRTLLSITIKRPHYNIYFWIYIHFQRPFFPEKFRQGEKIVREREENVKAFCVDLRHVYTRLHTCVYYYKREREREREEINS